MSVTVRVATPADAEAVCAVHGASIEGLGGQAYDDEQVAAWAHERDPAAYPIDEPGVHFVVADRDGEVVGFGDLHRTVSDAIGADVDGEVRAVYVLPGVAREGVGAAIYADLERRAREWGLASLGLHASLNAVPFYETQGFRRVAERVHEFSGGVDGTVVEMVKELRTPNRRDPR